MTRNVKWHKMSNDTKYQMAQNVKWHEISNDTKWHMTYDTWQMTNETWQMTHETKFQIAHYTHDTWHMIHDTWHMRYDVWCMTHDAWWSMTPDRNTRRHTLRSVHSSPGRPFLNPKSLCIWPRKYPGWRWISSSTKSFPKNFLTLHRFSSPART